MARVCAADEPGKVDQVMELERLIRAARGVEPADIVFRGGLLANVLSGEILEAALACLNKFARVAVCGWISTYNIPDAPGPRASKLWQLVANSVTIRGFVVIDYMDRFAEGVEQLAQWVMEGKLKYREEVVDGLDNILPTFLHLFDGSNQGKLVIRIPE